MPSYCLSRIAIVVSLFRASRAFLIACVTRWRRVFDSFGTSSGRALAKEGAEGPATSFGWLARLGSRSACESYCTLHPPRGDDAVKPEARESGDRSSSASRTVLGSARNLPPDGAVPASQRILIQRRVVTLAVGHQGERQPPRSVRRAVVKEASRYGSSVARSVVEKVVLRLWEHHSEHHFCVSRGTFERTL